MIILLYLTYDYGENEVLFVKLQLGFWSCGLIPLLSPSGANVVSRSQTPRSNVFLISWFYWIHLTIPKKMRSCLWKLQPGFWIYGLICLLGPNGPDVVSGPQTPRSRNFFEISWVYWIHVITSEKMRSCLWKLQLGFWIYGLIRLMGPSGPNVVSRPQTLRSRNFLRFHNSIGLISWFFRKWCPVCENCS